jgi:hypothetical protein
LKGSDHELGTSAVGGRQHLRGRLGGDEAERHLDRLLGQCLEQFQAGHLGHVPVTQHRVERSGAQDVEGLLAVLRLGDVDVDLAPEQVPEHGGDGVGGR